MSVDSVPRSIRYLAPNGITMSSMVFGLVSLWSSAHGNTPLAAWMIIYAVLTDRLDGIVARAMKATSELGMQLDSFADFLNFGIAPAYLVLSYISSRPEPELAFYQDGAGRLLLFAACSAYMLCAVFRLARYNILADDEVPTKIFFGIPTTLAGGMLAIWILVFLKYSPDESFGGAKLFGDSLVTPISVWRYMPIALVIAGYLMASRLPMPKIGLAKNRFFSMFLFACLVVGYACGFAMRYPELCFWMPTSWSVVFLIWGQTSARARAMHPPPLFPKRTVEGDKSGEKTRSQEDMPDLVLDTAEPGEPAEPADPGAPPP